MRVERLLCAALSSVSVVVACTGTPGTMYFEGPDEPGGSSGANNAASGGAAGAGAAGKEARGGAPALQGGRAGVGGTTLTGGTSPSSSGAVAGQPLGGSGALGTGGDAQTPAGTICSRFIDPGGIVRQVARGYQRAVFDDCRVAGMILRLEEASEFANAVVRYSLWLWGCPGTVEDAEFGLVYQTPELSRADATLLIQHYLDVSTELLSLSREERAAMHAELERGATRAITQVSEDAFTMNVCSSGGEGGQGGAGGQFGAGGSGGASDAGAGGAQEETSGGAGEFGGAGGSAGAR